MNNTAVKYIYLAGGPRATCAGGPAGARHVSRPPPQSWRQRGLDRQRRRQTVAAPRRGSLRLVKNGCRPEQSQHQRDIDIGLHRLQRLLLRLQRLLHRLQRLLLHLQRLLQEHNIGAQQRQRLQVVFQLQAQPVDAGVHIRTTATSGDKGSEGHSGSLE